MVDANPTTDPQLPDHTFGPWWVDDRREAGGALQVQAKHRGEGSSYCVATVNPWDQPNANARLIAAAPDLLEALRKIVSDGDYTAPEEMKRIARAAIDKATGEHS